MTENPTTRKRPNIGPQNFQEGPPEGAAEGHEQIMDTLYGLVGRIAGHWGILELSLDQTIWQICKLDPAQGACMTAQFTSTSARTRCILALVSETEGAERLTKKINQFDQSLTKMTKKRNRVVHDPLGWGLPDNKPMNFRAIAEKRLDFGWGEVSEEKYKSIMHEVIALRQEYEKLRAEILSHFHGGVSS